jgi:type IV pilus assembly protein PilM
MLSTKTVLSKLKSKSLSGKRGAKTALGIDISETRINLALLKKSADGIELLKTASGSMPDGVVKDGNIEDPTALAKAIMQLKNQNKIRSGQAAISLLARPMLMQIMDMPKQVPNNIGQFVQNEVKHYVILPGRKIALDYCGIGSESQTGKKRLFVVATDGENVAEVARACNRAGLNIDVIEPALLAYARAFHAKRIADKFDTNVLLAILQNGVLTLCVFRNDIVDFVRTKNLDSAIRTADKCRQTSIAKEKAQRAPASAEASQVSGPDKVCDWLEEEINAVIQFYNIEVPGSSQKWEVTVVADGVQLPGGAGESLNAKVKLWTELSRSPAANLHFASSEDAYQDTPVGKAQDVGSDKPSAAAIGLAMRLLGIDDINLRVNLLPPEVAEVKIVKRDALIIANIAAVVLFFMILTVGGLILTVGKVNKNVIHTKQTKLSHSSLALLQEQQLVDEQIGILTGRLGRINGVLSSHRDIEWVGILNYIRRVTPKTVQITNLSSVDNNRMYLSGSGLSREAVYLFVNMLNKSQHLASASLIETGKNSDRDKLISYAIDCYLSPPKER